MDGDEIADEWSWINLGNTTNGYSFPVQPASSNRLRRRQGNGCGYP